MLVKAKAYGTIFSYVSKGWTQPAILQVRKEGQVSPEKQNGYAKDPNVEKVIQEV